MGSFCGCNTVSRIRNMFHSTLANFPDFDLVLLNDKIKNVKRNGKTDSDSEEVSSINDEYDEKTNIEKYKRFKLSIIDNKKNEYSNIYNHLIPNYNELNNYVYSDLNANLAFIEIIFGNKIELNNDFVHNKFNKLMNLSNMVETVLSYDFLEEFILKKFEYSLKLYDNFCRYLRDNKGEVIGGIELTERLVKENEVFYANLSNKSRINSFRNMISLELGNCQYLKDSSSDDGIIDFSLFERLFYSHRYFFDIMTMNETYFDYIEKIE